MTTRSRIEAQRCADCERSDSAVTDLSPSQALAIPATALARLENAAGGGLTRRRALQHGVAGVAAVYAATQLPWSRVFEAARAEGAAGMQRSVVLIYLQGGADSLNMFVPDDGAYTAYAAHRKLGQAAGIARVQGAPSGPGQVGTTPMGGSGGSLAFANPLVSGAGRNGSSVGLDTLYGDGGPTSDLAIFPAADYNPPNRSHFESRDYWFAGALEQLSTGWVGRWLDRHGSRLNPLQAVSLDSSLSKQLRSSLAPVCALDGLNGIDFAMNDGRGGSIVANPQLAQLAKLPASSRNAALRRSRGVYGLTVDVSRQVGGLHVGSTTAPYPSGSGLSERLRMAATLLSAGLGTRFVTIDWGSFDTHGDQVSAQDPQLAELSAALAAFQADLRRRAIEDKVITLVFSEFGRRVDSNDSGGTDHGAGGPMMLMGSAIRGGLASPPSDPTRLDSNGDLIVKTDFRHVYKHVISEWLHTDPREILPDLPGGDLNRYDGSHTLLKAP